MPKVLVILIQVLTLISSVLLATVSIVSDRPLIRTVSTAALIISWTIFVAVLIISTMAEENDEDK